MHRNFRDGDLIRNRRSGELRCIVGEQFTKRFMDAHDMDMAAHGMGHLAGSYAGVYRTRVLSVDAYHAQGGTYTVKVGELTRGWINLTAQEEANETS